MGGHFKLVGGAYCDWVGGRWTLFGWVGLVEVGEGIF